MVQNDPKITQGLSLLTLLHIWPGPKPSSSGGASHVPLPSPAELEDSDETDVSLITGAMRTMHHPSYSSASSSVMLRNQTLTMANTTTAGTSQTILSTVSGHTNDSKQGTEYFKHSSCCFNYCECCRYIPKVQNIMTLAKQTKADIIALTHNRINRNKNI